MEFKLNWEIWKKEKYQMKWESIRYSNVIKWNDIHWSNWIRHLQEKKIDKIKMTKRDR